MSNLDWIFSRKSVRGFTDEPVSKEDLQQILHAAFAAPSARNMQPWEFVVVDQPDLLKQMGEELPNARMLATAQAAIVVCGDPSKTYDGKLSNPFWVMDCSAAAENILLAVESLGLGAVWTASYPYEERMEVVHRVLKVPAAVLPLCVIPIGHPANDETPKDKWNPQAVHWNEW